MAFFLNVPRLIFSVGFACCSKTKFYRKKILLKFKVVQIYLGHIKIKGDLVIFFCSASSICGWKLIAWKAFGQRIQISNCGLNSALSAKQSGTIPNCTVFYSQLCVAAEDLWKGKQGKCKTSVSGRLLLFILQKLLNTSTPQWYSRNIHSEGYFRFNNLV